MDSSFNLETVSSFGSISFRPSTQVPSNIDLPDTANSISGLEFIGFDHKTATHIFNTYNGYKEPFSSVEASNYDFFSFIHGHIIHINSARFDILSDREKMTKLGIRKEVQDAILDERFMNVFGTQTLQFWIEDTIRVNYTTLLRLKDQTNNIEPDLDSESLSKYCTTLDSPPKILENHTILYKTHITTTDPLFSEDGTLDVPTLNSPRGGDFNWLSEAQYWTPDLHLAERFRQYISLRCPFSTTLLLSLQMPDSFLASLNIEELWYGEEWKEYIRYCKTKSPPPSHLQHLCKADILIGHISIKSQHLNGKVSENDILMHQDGSKAIQWCFVREEKVREMMGLVRGKGAHVEIFGPLENGGVGT
jgi:hypothetical protein